MRQRATPQGNSKARRVKRASNVEVMAEGAVVHQFKSVYIGYAGELGSEPSFCGVRTVNVLWSLIAGKLWGSQLASQGNCRTKRQAPLGMDVLKVDCDEDGVGGDDAADALRYLVATKWRSISQGKLRGL